jgi:hypothetical protein
MSTQRNVHSSVEITRGWAPELQQANYLDRPMTFQETTPMGSCEAT